ncbi:MAG TPA: HD domain-containing protein [Thermomicrobiales bacterium]|nr:HD domain-containing protein [Thermomicrobiales bacterium]
MTDSGAGDANRRSDLGTLVAHLAELKRIPRTGWLDRGLPSNEAESVADHSLLAALIAWLTAMDDPDLDADHVLKLALVHDLAEAIFGDLPPYDRAEVPTDPGERDAFFRVRHLRTPENAAAKRAAESDAAATLLDLMPETARAEFSSLWDEYEARETSESRFVKQVDRLEAFLQARIYAQDHPDLPLDGFTDMAEKEIHHPALTALRDEVE